MQCVTLRVKPVLTSTTRIRLPKQCEGRHRRWKATFFPSGAHAGESSPQRAGGWVIWRMWLPLGYIVKMVLLVPSRSKKRRKTIRPSVEALPAKLLVLLLCSTLSRLFPSTTATQRPNNADEDEQNYDDPQTPGEDGVSAPPAPLRGLLLGCLFLR